ncbi:MAG: M23 family metallopeptidase [Bacteroidales bacterium]|nr:M23 family metallopeptidase [Bacteroidales bacterium]
MMNRTLNGRGALLRLAATIPVTAAAFLAFGCGVKSPLPASETETNLADDTIVEYVIPCLSTNGTTADNGGIDYILNEGDAVWAAADGRIVDIHDGYRSLVKFKPGIIELLKPFTPIKEENGCKVYDCGNGTTLFMGYDVEGGDHFTSKANGSGKGLNVTIEHADGSRTTYAHLSRIRFRGPWIKTGDIIGYAGSTGNATDTHLHFEVIKESKVVTPDDMKPIQTITLTIKDDKVYHDRKPLDLEKGEVEELARRFGEISEYPSIQLKLEGDVKVGTVTDVKEQMRNAGATRLTLDNDGGATLTKPLPAYQASVTGIKVQSIMEILPEISRRNIIQVKINKEGKVLMMGNDGEYYISEAENLDIEALKNMISNPENLSVLPEKAVRDIPMPDGSTVKIEVSKAFVTLEPSEATGQNDYLVLQKRVRQAYDEMRDRAAMEKFGRKMDELSKEEKHFIYLSVPMNICEVSPKPERI